MAKFLRLGRFDDGARRSQSELRRYFELYHNKDGFPPEHFNRFRDDIRRQWYDPEPIEGEDIRSLTQFLQRAGFMPNANHDGIFGYGTQAAVRLFQEYVRAEDDTFADDPAAPACWPDGVVGRDTGFYLNDWRSHDKRTRWARGREATQDFQDWHAWLNAAAEHFRRRPSVVMQHLIDASRRGDSLVPDDWRFPTDEPLLIGIRRNAHIRPPAGQKRPPDDLFVLLVNGMSFYFWGSTDSNPAKKSGGRKRGEGFLIEGQHNYRFNWHNLSPNRRPNIYKAMKPATVGVMVVRDVKDHDALTEQNRREGFDPRPNTTFNIHWSGLGISNWSAGCQVISGLNYINDAGRLVSCRDYAARSNSARGSKGRNGARQTMGAYTVLSDLLLSYIKAPNHGEKPTVRYTLFREEDLQRVPGLDTEEIARKLRSMKAERL